MHSPYLIPVVAIIFGCSIPIVALFVDYRKKKAIYELHHRERLAAIEKGMEIPPLPPDLLSSQPSGPRHPRFLLRGLIWSGIGIGMLFALPHAGEEEVHRLGVIPLAIGIAYLVYYVLEGRKIADEERKVETSTPPPVS